MTRLRQMMLEELQRRNYSKSTTRYYLQAVASFARHFGKSPDKLGPDELRSYQAYLLRERKLAVGTVIARVAALRFFFIRTLKRHEFREDLPYPKDQRRLPTVLSLEEVARLINAAGNLLQRALLMTLYGTGMRRTEVSLLKLSDIDRQRMMIRVERGKGGAGRDIPLSPALLETLREYWRWKKPRTYLFPSSERKRGKEQPISDKTVWYACKQAARHAGLLPSSSVGNDAWMCASTPTPSCLHLVAIAPFPTYYVWLNDPRNLTPGAHSNPIGPRPPQTPASSS